MRQIIEYIGGCLFTILAQEVTDPIAKALYMFAAFYCLIRIAIHIDVFISEVMGQEK